MRWTDSLVRRLAAIAATVALAVPSAWAAHPEPARGSGGAVASANVQATAVGIETLRAGGNAVDAAVAVALALAVVHPQAGNLGGGGFAVVRMDGKPATLDFREVAPAAATPGMFLDRKGQPDPEKSLVGPLAAGVPGSPAGLFELHRRYGKLPWQRVVAPAVRLAADGFIVSARLARDIGRHRKLLERFPETARVWLSGGRLPQAGATMRLPELAATLRGYAVQGPGAITGGPAAAAVELVTRRYGGVLRAPDLAGYRPVWRAPLRLRLFGWQAVTMDLPSSGGIILGETAGMLQRLGWSDHPRFGADRAHLLAEAFRRAYADRFQLGDPLTTRAQADDLLQPGWVQRRAGGIVPGRATPSSDLAPWPGVPAREHLETTHISVADGAGNLVALTTTLNGAFGCGVTVPGLGFLLNNEMDDFAAAPGRPNTYGLVQGRANAVAPGKRMLSSMSPTLVWSGRQAVAIGSPGGSRIPTATLQVLLNLLVDGDQLQAAVDRPRIHHQWLPDRIDAEPDALSPETRAELERRGHRVRIVQRMGRINVVRVIGDGGVEAVADPRGPGSAAVVVSREASGR